LVDSLLVILYVPSASQMVSPGTAFEMAARNSLAVLTLTSRASANPGKKTTTSQPKQTIK
jgi:hypothetical protein